MTLPAISDEARRFREHWFECVRARMKQLVGAGFEKYGRGVMPCDGLGAVRYGTRQTEIWSKIVAAYKNVGHDPFLVAVDVCDAHNGVKPPYPNVMLSPAIIESRVDTTTRELRELTTVQTQRTALYNHMTDLSFLPQFAQAADRAALCSLKIRVSPLLRYCEAAARGHVDLSQQFFNAATLEYGRKRDIVDRVWSKAGVVIPPALRGLTSEQLLARRAT